jgi:paraquat-inducible protein B
MVMATLECIDKVAASLGPVTASVRTTADEAVALVKDVRKTLADDLGKDIRGLLAQIKELIEKDVAPAVRGATAASDRLPATFDRLEATLDRVGAAMIRAERLAREERGPLDETLENLRGLTADLRDVTGQLRKYPSQVLLGDPPPRSKVVDK